MINSTVLSVFAQSWNSRNKCTRHFCIRLRHMFRMIRRVMFFPAMVAMVLVPKIFPYSHMRRNNVFLNLLFDVYRDPKGMMTIGAFGERFVDDFVNVIRRGAGHADMSGFLTGLLPALVRRIRFCKSFVTFLLFFFYRLFSFANTSVLIKNYPDQLIFGFICENNSVDHVLIIRRKFNSRKNFFVFFCPPPCPAPPGGGCPYQLHLR